MNEFVLQSSNHLSLDFYNELHCGIDYEKSEYIILNLPQIEPKLDGNLLLINFCFFEHYPDDFIESYNRYSVKAKQKLLLEKPHFMSHPAYGFEYCTQKGRAFFRNNPIKLKILKEE